MRCFVAVDIDPSLTGKVTELQKPLHGLDVKLIEPQNLHFTLKFLGEVDDVAEIESRLDKLAKSTGFFSINISGIGVFPNEQFISVVWVGAPKLETLQVSVNNALSGLLDVEKPIPHMTIARVRSQTYRKELVEFVSKHTGEVGSMRVDCIKLKKSTLAGSGPIYEDLAVFRLGAKDD